MAVKTPVRGDFNGSGDLTGLSEFQASDFIGIGDGGTGATTAAGARTALSLVVGTNVQAFDAQLTDVAGLAVTDGGFIVGDGSNFVLETGNTARASLGLGTSDSPTFNGLTLSGNLIINGTTTTINSTIVTVDDPIFTLGGDTAPGSDDNKDRGIEFRYHNGSTAKLGFFGFDDSSGKFTFIPDATNTSEVFSGTAGTIVANLEGNVTGTVSSLSNLDTDGLSEGSSNLYFTNERVDDRVGALLIDSATSGIDINYDDANGQLTISTDLGEITSDLNERVDDRVDSLLTAGSNVSLTYDDSAGTLTIASTDTNTQLTTEQVQDIVGGMVDGGTETNVTVTYDDTNGRLNFVVDQLTSEQVQDIIGPMFASNTETFIDVTYDDNDGTLDLIVPVKDEDNMASNSDTHLATQQSIKAYVDASVAPTLTQEQVEDFVAGLIVGGTNVTATYDDAGGTLTLASTDTNTQLTQEQVEDFVGGMLDGTETLITVGYDDTNGNIDFVVDNDLANYSNTNSAFITKSGISVTDAGGDGSLSYNNGTGVITYTGPSQAEVLAHVSAGTGITISGSGAIATTITQYANSDVQSYLSGGTGVTLSGSGEFSIGQAVATNSNVQFNNIQVDGVLTSNDITSSNISIDGNATITGNLTVEGTSTQVDSTTVTVADPLFKYAKDNTGNSVDIGFYGKYVQSSTTKYAGLAWDASQTDKFRLFHGNQTEPTTTVDTSGTGHTTGTLIANIEGNVTGNVTGNVSGTSGSTTGNAATATALASAQNFSLTGDVTASAVSFDGSGAVALSTTITDNSVQVGNIDFLVDEDNMASDSAVKVPTQQSVKAYVDSQVTAQDLDFQADSGGALAIDLDSETLSFTGGTGIDTSGSGNQISVAIDSSVATLTGTQTLTNKTINLENNIAIVEYAVTVASVGGSNKFLIDGEAQATISFNPGIVYRFDLSDNSLSGHPFKLSTTDNGSHNSGSEYTTGKTTNGSQGSAGAYVEYTVNAATSDILYYYCSSHSGMGGTITVFGSSYGDADVQSYLSAGTGITLSGSGVIATTITQYADSDVQSYLSAGTGITLSGSGVIASSITQYADSDVASYLSSNSYATQSYVTTQVNNLIDSAPGALNTLNELAAALGDDANFSTTITNSIATKLATSDFNSTLDARLSGGNGITYNAGAISVDATTITGQTAETSIADDDLILIYDDSASALRKMTKANFTAGLSGGGGTVTEAFRTIAVSGQTDIVADSATDSLTFAAGSNITITTNAGSDTVTIAATDTNTQLTTEQVQDIVGGMVDGGTETNISVTYDDTNGKINFVSTDTNTQLTQEQVEDFAANVLVAGTNITKTYDDSAGTLTIAATGGAANAFSTIAVSGQSNVVADATTDTLTLAAGSGMTLTTNAGSDTITFASSGGGSGSMPVTLAGGSSDPIVLSQATSIGAIPFVSFNGSTDNINLSGSTQAVTSFTDNDGDTKLEVERSADNDTVFIKAGGTDVLTATSSGVTISNLTVTGTSTQANEMKITDTLIELNADATSLGVDAGLVIERGNTGADAAFIWDESSDSFAVGLLSTDRAVSFTKANGNAQDIPISSNEVAFNHANGSADNLPITGNNLAFTEANGTSDPIASFAYGPDTDMNVKLVDATLKAKTQSQSDNSTKVATTAYVDTALGGVSSNSITDADGDTKIQVEEGSDEDIIRADTAGQERVTIDNNVSMSARGGFFTHNATMHASETFTIAATEGTVAAGPLDVQGTVDVQGTLVVV